MTATPKQATIVYWFLGAAGLFFARALLFSTWLSRAPEVQQALSLGTAQMGLLVMLFPLGGLAGILFANPMMVRLGSTAVCANVTTHASTTRWRRAFTWPWRWLICSHGHGSQALHLRR